MWHWAVCSAPLGVALAGQCHQTATTVGNADQVQVLRLRWRVLFVKSEATNDGQQHRNALYTEGTQSHFYFIYHVRLRESYHFDYIMISF